MFEQLRFGPEGDRQYDLPRDATSSARANNMASLKRLWEPPWRTKWRCKVGDRISTTHGDPEGKGHGRKFTVVGILAPSGTPNDRAAFVNMEGFFLMKGHAKPLNEKPLIGRGSASQPDAAVIDPRALPKVPPEPAEFSSDPARSTGS